MCAREDTLVDGEEELWLRRSRPRRRGGRRRHREPDRTERCKNEDETFTSDGRPITPSKPKPLSISRERATSRPRSSRTIRSELAAARFRSCSRRRRCLRGRRRRGRAPSGAPGDAGRMSWWAVEQEQRRLLGEIRAKVTRWRPRSSRTASAHKSAGNEPARAQGAFPVRCAHHRRTPMQITKNSLATVAGPSDWFTGAVLHRPRCGAVSRLAAEREQRPLHPGRPHGLAHTPERSDDLGHRGSRSRAAPWRPDRGHPPGRPRLLRAGRGALARRRRDPVHGPRRDARGRRRRATTRSGATTSPTRSTGRRLPSTADRSAQRMPVSTEKTIVSQWPTRTWTLPGRGVRPNRRTLVVTEYNPGGSAIR